MEHASRLAAQCDRIWGEIKDVIGTQADDREFISNDRLWSIWEKSIGDLDSQKESDEFQQCVPSAALSSSFFMAYKTISILIWIHWHDWRKFEERFCRLTGTERLDDIRDIDGLLPISKDSLRSRLFPDDRHLAKSFYLHQFIFVPPVLEENSGFKSYDPEYRLPILDESTDVQETECSRILPVHIAEGHYKFAGSGQFNAEVQSQELSR
jgi:hypothetical protein